MLRVLSPFLFLAALAPSCLRAAENPRPIKLLFLGDNGHHEPAVRFRQFLPSWTNRGIDVTYTDKVTALNAKTLADYDGIIVYANTTAIAPDQEQALLDFVASGKGLIALHCASYCFLNSPKYVELVGAQFSKHGTGTFRTQFTASDHPILRGFGGFESWDETYVHTKHNETNRTVLEYRVDGATKEPWTWVRTHGRGRVFYTAWGHDRRTWGHPGFQNLIERGIRWATGGDPSAAGDYRGDPAFPIPAMTPRRTDVAAFEYLDVGKSIPNYTPGRDWGAKGEAHSKMQKPLSPEESLKHIVTPQGFHAELFVTEQQLGGGKPICMTWDERGRLWVALTTDYPNQLQPPMRGRDRIVICDDSDGDGRADAVTVFAEGLSIPSGMLCVRGGVLVFDAGQTVFWKDSDGDGKADIRKVEFGTWSLPDTHGGPSNMQYGLDNWVWAMQGYNRSVLRVGGETHTFRQGFFRFRSDGSKLEFLRSTDNNTWGLGLSEEGLVFGSTANRCPSVFMPIPNRYYEGVRGWTPELTLRMISDTHLFKPITKKIRQVDQFGGYTAAAGHALYTARNYPQEYWNRTAFVCEPTGHLVGAFVLRRDGSAYQSKNPFNLLASDDEWTSPTMAEVGPDGNVWVIDWYNFIVQHNPTPQGFKTGKGAAYETELRDKKHARIYRVVYDGAKKTDRFTLAGASPQKLVETLKHDNMFWRKQAQRLLVERGERDVVPALIAAAKDQNVDEIGLNAGVIHALWAMHGLGVLDGSHADATDVALQSLRHPSAGVRRNALQVLPRHVRSVEMIVSANVVQDGDSQVRLAALLALADQPASPMAVVAIAQAMNDPSNIDDRGIQDAAICAAATNAPQFLQAAARIPSPSSKLIEACAIVAGHYARSGPTDSVGALFEVLEAAPVGVVNAVVRGLASGWPSASKPLLDSNFEQMIEKLIERLEPARRGELVKLAVAWGCRRFDKYLIEVAKALLERVRDSGRSTVERLAAARELIAQRPADAETVQNLLDLVSSRLPPELAVGLLQSVSASEASGVDKRILSRLDEWTPGQRSAAINILLGRPDWTRALLDAGRAKKIALADLSLVQRQSLSEHPDAGIREQARDWLKQGGGLADPDRQKVLESLLGIVKEKGDVAAGKKVFLAQCAKCHVHGGEGERIGPDLTGMAVHPKEHLLAEIVDPNRSVEANYRSYVVRTKKGTVLTGLLAGESRTSIELFDAEGKKASLRRDELDDIAASGKSLMPDGIEKLINRTELTDLLEFLTQRGRYLPLPLAKAATSISTRGMFFAEESRAERLVFADWKPKTVEGVPFHLIDPIGERVPNVVLLYGPHGTQAPKMPKSVTVPCNAAAKSIHILGGISGWGFPLGEKGSVSMIVRLHYADNQTEDHPLRNGEHLADYNQQVDVPGSSRAFNLRGRQVRYLSVSPQRSAVIERIELVKGPDATAPIVVAITVETP